MKWVVLTARVLVGLGFVVFSLNYFVPFLTMSMPEPPEAGKSLMGGLIPTGWMNVVKVCELVGGLLLLSGRLTPLGVVVLMPVAVNILLWDLLVMKQPSLGVLFTALLGVVMAGYWNYFSPFFKPTAKMV